MGTRTRVVVEAMLVGRVWTLGVWALAEMVARGRVARARMGRSRRAGVLGGLMDVPSLMLARCPSRGDDG